MTGSKPSRLPGDAPKAGPSDGDIILMPGGLYFAEHPARIRTVLGSCVSMVFWHPFRRIGAMCHYMLPDRTRHDDGGAAGRYADEAIAILLGRMRDTGTTPGEYEVKVFGGASMFSGQGLTENHVGARNVAAAHALVARHGLHCVAQHTGGVGHRQVVFDVRSGRVWVKHQSPLTPDMAKSGVPATGPATAQCIT